MALLHNVRQYIIPGRLSGGDIIRSGEYKGHGGLKALPIDSLIRDIKEAVVDRRVLIISAFAGSGKTTRIPPALLDLCKGKILVLEPRRIAARLAAARVAFERGEQCGETVGYQVRYEDVASGSTRLKYVTEGILLKYMLSNPELRGVDFVILDEFHERHLFTDTALALLRHLQETKRPDLRLLIMSATLQEKELQSYFPDAGTFTMEGKLHPLDIQFSDPAPERPLCKRVADAVNRLISSPGAGHILVFLPGAAEIRASMDALQEYPWISSFELLELRSELTYEEQARVFATSERRKIILSTNIAESSVTIEGVTGVVDSGLAKIAGWAHWNGLPTLDVRAVSKASCIQRAGRAGRLSSGIVRRLYTSLDYSKRPAFDVPEIMRCDLTQVILDLTIVLEKLGRGDMSLRQIPWMTTPPQDMLDAGRDLLLILGAFDGSGRVTEQGRRLSLIPLHARLGRMILEGERSGCLPQAILLAAIISEGMILRRSATQSIICDCDVEHQRELFTRLMGSKKMAMESHIDRGKVFGVERLARHLCALYGLSFQETLKTLTPDEVSEIIFAGFPDRVAAVRDSRKGFSRSPGKVDEIPLNLCSGGGGALLRTSGVRNSPFIMAIEADASCKDAANAVKIRVASSVSPELLVLSGNDFVKSESFCTWDEKEERVKGVCQTRYGKLLLEEKVSLPEEGCYGEIIFDALRRLWPKPFSDNRDLICYTSRSAFLRSCGIHTDFPDLEQRDFEKLLRHICRGKRSFEEVRRQSLDSYIGEILSPEMRRDLEKLAPLRIQIGLNRRTLVHYESGKKPWVASRIQDFFGSLETPKICGGRVALIVHLLAPNGLAVQVTDDLVRFWESIYPSVKKELCRRYPRHYWPENPLLAEPRLPGRTKRRN